MSVSTALGVSVLMGLPTMALADEVSDIQAQADEAGTHLDELYSKQADTGEKLLQTQVDLERTDDEIEHRQADLNKAQDVLASNVTASYKGGGVSIMDIFVDSGSLPEFVTKIAYASKASQAEADAIENVKQIQSDLNEKQAQLQSLRTSQQAQKNEIDQETADAKSYKDSLDSQVQEALAQKQAEEQRRQQQAAAQAQQQAAARGGYVTATDVQGATGAAATDDGGAAPVGGGANEGGTHDASPTPSKPSGGGSSSNGGGGSSSAAWRNTVVAAAWGQIGVPYVWGGTTPAGFDCSGLTGYCYAAAGISLPRTSEEQGAWGRATNDPQPGDLVCYGSHVAIYLGNGRMIHAPHPGDHVREAAVYGHPWYRTR